DSHSAGWPPSPGLGNSWARLQLSTRVSPPGRRTKVFTPARRLVDQEVGACWSLPAPASQAACQGTSSPVAGWSRVQGPSSTQGGTPGALHGGVLEVLAVVVGLGVVGVFDRVAGAVHDLVQVPPPGLAAGGRLKAAGVARLTVVVAVDGHGPGGLRRGVRAEE